MVCVPRSVLSIGLVALGNLVETVRFGAQCLGDLFLAFESVQSHHLALQRSDMKRDLHKYLAAAAGAPAFNRVSVDDYTDALLQWLRVNGNAFPAWGLAARVVFAISPNSASCERVFALLKRMYGDEQLATLGDAIQASLMLAYNERRVG